MRNLFIVLCLLFSQNAESHTPGGVGDYLLWERPRGGGQGEVVINFNRVDKFTPLPDDLRLSEKSGTLTGLSFISVSMSDTLRERVLWSLETDTATMALMTTRRFANLQEYRYVNFVQTEHSAPLITSFTSRPSRGNLSLKRQAAIRLGSTPGSDVPVGGFEGIFPEYVIYDRVLSYSERLRVESYLALKYGISLSQAIATNYLNSRGEVIWDSRKFYSYRSNISGVGRDDLSGLYQRRSGSMQTPGLLDIECNGLEDGDFLIWGDNRQPLTFLNRRGEPKRLQRMWGMAVTGHFLEKPSVLNFSARQIREIDPLGYGEVYWLAIDDAGTGEYNTGSANFYANTSGNNYRLRFEDIIWDKNQSGSDVFTLFAAPSMFSLIDLHHPRCMNNTKGYITASVVGGEPPFTASIYRDDQIVATKTANGRIFEFGELHQGVYRLMVSDRGSRVYAEEFLLANADMAEVGLFEPVTLTQGSSRVFDGASGYLSPMNYTFRWQCPVGGITHGSEISVDKAGVYLLTVTGQNGCSTLRELDVREAPGSKIRYVEVIPNPTTKGYVDVRVQLAHRGTLEVLLSNSLGHTINYKEISGSDFYTFRVDFPDRGVWFITIRSAVEQKSLKVISM